DPAADRLAGVLVRTDAHEPALALLGELIEAVEPSLAGKVHDRARAIEMLALDAGRFEEFARKSKSIVGARDTGRPALVAELARVAFAVAESPGHRRLGHLCLLGADPPAHGCRAIPACARRAAGREGKSSI